MVNDLSETPDWALNRSVKSTMWADSRDSQGQSMWIQNFEALSANWKVALRSTDWFFAVVSSVNSRNR